jgi:ferrous iron transport protein A
MVPLSLSNTGEKVIVRSIGGTGHIAKTLGHLGIIIGTELTIIQKNKESLIIRVGESRYALGHGAASMVLVESQG